MSGIKAFILHLERAAGRAPTVAALQSALPVVSEILPAIDGALLEAHEVQAAYVRERYRPRYPFALGANEIGVFLSHRAAWARIVDERLDFAVVLEDDAALDPALFSALVELALGERRKWDYALMPAAGLEPKGSVVAQQGESRLVRPYTPPLRAIAQFVSRAAAERLLAVTAPFDRPVDTFLQMNWVTGVTLMAALPTPIRDVSRSTGGTTVQRKRLSLAERLHREIMRPVYRAQVLALYRREALKARSPR
ncbi:MAG: glycosyltransferase family 25 protein [Hyphomicrobiales bacterium]|nr:glycosyltransferase family 25 protein [Hyphomicrobiales bacterium]